MIYKEYYEAIANRRNIWNADPRSDLSYQEHVRYDAILRNIPSSIQNVLDLGCGDGYLSFLIAQKGLRVTSLDISLQRMKKFEEAARQYHIHRVISNVCAPGFASQNFDLIVCSEVIEHIEDYPVVLKEVFRLLKPGGKFIVTVPYKEKLKTLLCPHCQQGFHENGHLHSFDTDKLSADLMRVGLTVLKAQTLRHRLLVQIQYHSKMKYGFFLRNLDRIFSLLNPEFTKYMLVMAQK